MVALIIVVVVLFGVWASADIGSGVYVKALCRVRTKQRVAALTFDDGPHPVHTPMVLDVLKRRGVRAVFFVTGRNAEANPEIVRRMVAEGHLVGNHTHSHSAHFPLGSAAKMREDIERCDAVLQKITGVRPTLFRPPFGVTNPTLARALSGKRTVVGWSIRSLDTVRRLPRERVRRRMHPGAVILLHDDRAGSGELTDMILQDLKNDGYEVVRLDKLKEQL